MRKTDDRVSHETSIEREAYSLIIRLLHRFKLIHSISYTFCVLILIYLKYNSIKFIFKQYYNFFRQPRVGEKRCHFSVG